jgi:hypothetical protein
MPGSDGRVDRLAQAIAARVATMVVDAIDFNSVLARIDIADIVRRVDVEGVVDRIDIDAIAQQIDIEAIIRRVDVNSIVESIDIDSLISRTELGSIIARSTSGIFTELLDLVRSQVVGLDDFVMRLTNRLLGRGQEDLPAGPSPL